MSTEGRDNYIAVLFLAWAYISSAQWVELLARSPTHTCIQRYTEGTPGHSLAGFDIGYEIIEADALGGKRYYPLVGRRQQIIMTEHTSPHGLSLLLRSNV